MQRSCLAAVCAGLVLCVLVYPSRRLATVVHAQETWDVIVGGDGPQATTYAFWPGTLTIQTGDTVRWSFLSLFEQHTVSFLRGDPAPPIYLPGPGAGEQTLGPAWFPMGTIVGRGTFDNTQDLSSGAMFGAQPPLYTLTFTTAGVFSYDDLLHPGMRGTITVLDGDGTLSETPAQALARGQSDLQQRLDTLGTAIAAADLRSPDQIPQPSFSAAGAAVHPVDIGLSDPGGAGALAFFPGNLTVKRGDAVLWTNTDVYGEHTVTFTSGAQPPDLPSVQSSGPPLLVLTQAVAGPVGGGSYGGDGYVSSGLLPQGATFALTISAPPGTYTYVDLLHPGVMQGTITVSDGP